jgi:membrane-bound lytic murein transglycosylase A
VAAGLALLAAACAPRVERLPDALTLRPAAFADLSGWRDDDMAQGLEAFRRSCTRLLRLPPDRPLGEGVPGVAAHWRGPCEAAAALGRADGAAARAFFETWFLPWRAANRDDPAGLFTGYYEPELRGAWERKGRFQTPLYARPGDLVTVDLGRFRDELKGQRIAGRVKGGELLPYDTRADIDGGTLAGRRLEILWVDDPVDAFFLHVQGSGRVVMEDGRTVRLGYAAQNGHPYQAIGRVLVERGALAKDDVSMQTIRAWLAANPGEARAVMAANRSYVFFRALDGDGPVGAQGVVLVPGRSLAVDPRFVPLGVPLWLDAADPLAPGRPLRRLVVAQDTGGAIKGPVRGDLFLGAGPEAAERAGRMKERGGFYLLLPRAAGPCC